MAKDCGAKIKSFIAVVYCGRTYGHVDRLSGSADDTARVAGVGDVQLAIAQHRYHRRAAAVGARLKARDTHVYDTQ